MNIKHTMSADFFIRSAFEADADAIAILTQELGYPADSGTIRERLTGLLARSDYLVTVAQCESGEICGWLQAHSSEELESGFRVEILGLVVATHKRRQRIGRLLIDHAEAWAAQVCAPAIVVRSNVKRDESHAFYSALGYERTKTQHVYRKLVLK